MDTVKGKVIRMDTIGKRLRAERERLKMSQSSFAELAGASKPSQVRYESGERYPDGAYFERLAPKGVDVLYILTGQENPMLSDRRQPSAGEMSQAQHQGFQEISGEKGSQRREALRAGFLPIPWNHMQKEATRGPAPIAFSNAWLADSGLDPERLSMVSVSGDAMEPLIFAGSLALLDAAPRVPEHDLWCYALDGAMGVALVSRPSRSSYLLTFAKFSKPPLTIDSKEANRFQLVGRVAWAGRSF